MPLATPLPTAGPRLKQIHAGASHRQLSKSSWEIVSTCSGHATLSRLARLQLRDRGRQGPKVVVMQRQVLQLPTEAMCRHVVYQPHTPGNGDGTKHTSSQAVAVLAVFSKACVAHPRSTLPKHSLPPVPAVVPAGDPQTATEFQGRHIRLEPGRCKAPSPAGSRSRRLP